MHRYCDAKCKHFNVETDMPKEPANVNCEDRLALERRSREAGTENLEPSKTLQAPSLEADVNYIAKTYGLGGKGRMPIPPELYDPANFMDMGDIPDLQTAMNYVKDAERQFDTLPAELRSRFKHSPGFLWDWLQDQRNWPEAVTLGILHERAPAAPPEAEKPPA